MQDVNSNYAISLLPTLNNICAIVITFNPDIQFNDRLFLLTQQFPLVVVVDNASQGASAGMLKNLDGLSGVALLLNECNHGIAVALNQGMAVAFDKGFAWAATFDQDSVISSDFLAAQLHAYAAIGLDKILLGGNYQDVHKQRNFVEAEYPGQLFQERKTLITSGMLVPLAESILFGGFREDYFIDSVDHEFCLRARKHGYRIFISCKPVMRHSIGSKMEASRYFSRFASFNHSPTRKYFIARNTLTTARLYFFREPLWSIRQGWRLASDFASIVLFEKNKLKKTKAFLLGLCHALSGRMGPVTDRQASNWK